MNDKGIAMSAIGIEKIKEINKSFSVILIFTLVFAFVFVLVGISNAAIPITGCMDITEPGEYQLMNDIDASEYLATHHTPGSPLYCIRIFSNDIILDGMGHIITCNSTYSPYSPALIRTEYPLNNITIKNTDLGNMAIYLSEINGSVIENVTGYSLMLFKGENIMINNNNIHYLRIGEVSVVESSSETEIPPSITSATISNNQFDGMELKQVVNSVIEGNNGSISFGRCINNQVYNNIVSGKRYGMIFSSSSVNHLRGNKVCSNTIDYSCRDSTDPIIDEGGNFGDIVDGCDSSLSPTTCGTECMDNDADSPVSPYLISSNIELTSFLTGEMYSFYDYCNESILHEAECGDTRYESINCTEEFGDTYTCDDGRCISSYSPPDCTCSGDSGNDPFNPGLCIYDSSSYPDTCNDNNLTEYFCDSGVINPEEYNCEEYGMVCNTNYAGLGYCTEDTETCIDTDGGGPEQQFYPGFVSYEGIDYDDTCIDDSHLQEYYCDSSLGMMSTEYTCSCITNDDGLGMCDPCTDTDPENNVTIPGQCINNVNDDVSYDSCNGWLSSTINEYSCNDLACLTGDGCVQQTVSCPDDESCIEFDNRAVCCDYSDILSSIFDGSSTISCSDSDHHNYLIPGILHVWGDAAEGVCGGDGGPFDEIISDTCIDGEGNAVHESDQLMEYYCNSYHIPPFGPTIDYPDEETISCSEQFGPSWHCEDGACVNTECHDSDGGINIWLGGDVSDNSSCSDYCIDSNMLHECYCSLTGSVESIDIDCSGYGAECDSWLRACISSSGGPIEPSCTEETDTGDDVHVLGSVFYVDSTSSINYYDTCQGSDMFSVYQVSCNGTDVSYSQTPCPEGEHCSSGVCVPGECVEYDGGNNPYDESPCIDVYGTHNEICSDSASTEQTEWYCGSDNLCHNETISCPSGACYSGECLTCYDPDESMGDRDILYRSTCISTLVNLTDICVEHGREYGVQEAKCLHGVCVYSDAKDCPHGYETCLGGACRASIIGPHQPPIGINKTIAPYFPVK